MHEWFSWIANGIPMILLLGLWVFFMRRMQRGTWGKVYEKQLELLEQQISVLRQTNELLKKLVEAR